MKDALLYEQFQSGTVHCFLCAHGCKIPPNSFGICSVRQNFKGKLYTHAYGRVIAQQVDPVEKKPLYHFLPGTKTFSISTIGCNFKCGFCQNWQISQLGADQRGDRWGSELTPQGAVELAQKCGCGSISFTYTEPTIFFEYALEICKLAKKQGISTIFVSNGYMSGEALKEISPWLDACNIDLKSFSDRFYNKFCHARLEPVLNCLKTVAESDIWLEITTLLVTGENDSSEELELLASFIARELGKDVPWHISRFFPQYDMTDHSATPLYTIKNAEITGKKHGLRYIYPGNVSGPSDTVCFRCRATLVKREGYDIQELWIRKGSCNQCGAEIAGVWH
ncbi:radical SAM protein [Chitinispirillum alkaliphilum]|nr:radical SAM protein [Chitinispirillum alkaliphilum]